MINSYDLMQHITNGKAQPRMKQTRIKGWKRWTKTDMRILKKRFNDGLSDAQIAQELGRTYKSIKHMRKKMNLKSKSGRQLKPTIANQVSNGLTEQKKNRHRKKWTREEIEILKVRVNEGLPEAQIAVELGRTEEAINKRRILSMKNDKPKTTSQIEYKSTQPSEEQMRNIWHGQIKEISLLWGLFKFTKKHA